VLTGENTLEISHDTLLAIGSVGDLLHAPQIVDREQMAAGRYDRPSPLNQ